MSMKALLIVSALGGGIGDYEVEMPTMKDCLAARISITEQDKTAKSICVPAVAETDKMEKFFSVFMSLVTKMKELESEYPSTGTLNNKCSNCER
jgi:hypothetical protein